MVAVARGRTGWAGAGAALLIGLAGAPAVAHGAPRAAARTLTGRVGVLDAVHVVAPGNVWAGGYHNPLTAPLLFHKRRGWHARTVPGVPAGIVDAIDATSRTDVWAAGDSLYHWDGARWRTVPAPHPGTEPTYYGVAALSPSNAWAVGGYLDDNAEIERTLIAHWNGRSWHRVPSPSLGYTDLRSVSFVSAKDGWAVGGRLVLHWDGARWARVAIPHGMGSTKSLVAVSKRDVWVVGASVWHWNGTAWHEAAYRLRGNSSLSAVDAYAANGVWAVGRACTAHDGCHTLALRWDGARWTRTATPNPAAGVIMTGVSAFGSGDVWAVGYHGGTGNEQVVAMHWTGHRWSLG
jgi:hypothetical protein